MANIDLPIDEEDAERLSVLLFLVSLSGNLSQYRFLADRVRTIVDESIQKHHNEVFESVLAEYGDDGE